MLYSINRGKDAPVYGIEHFMFQYRARQNMAPASAPTGPVLPGPREGVRYALPGERPPSRRPPGTNDDVIERFDRYAQRFKGGTNGR
jgi:hypothetical protein